MNTLISVLVFVALFVPGMLFYATGNIFGGPIVRMFTIAAVISVVCAIALLVFGQPMTPGAKAAATASFCFLGSALFVQSTALFLKGWKEKAVMAVWLAGVVALSWYVPNLVFEKA